MRQFEVSSAYTGTKHWTSSQRVATVVALICSTRKTYFPIAPIGNTWFPANSHLIASDCSSVEVQEIAPVKYEDLFPCKDIYLLGQDELLRVSDMFRIIFEN